MDLEPKDVGDEGSGDLKNGGGGRGAPSGLEGGGDLRVEL